MSLMSYVVLVGGLVVVSCVASFLQYALDDAGYPEIGNIVRVVGLLIDIAIIIAVTINKRLGNYPIWFCCLEIVFWTIICIQFLYSEKKLLGILLDIVIIGIFICLFGSILAPVKAYIAEYWSEKEAYVAETLASEEESKPNLNFWLTVEKIASEASKEQEDSGVLPKDFDELLKLIKVEKTDKATPYLVLLSGEVDPSVTMYLPEDLPTHWLKITYLGESEYVYASEGGTLIRVSEMDDLDTPITTYMIIDLDELDL